MLVNGLPEHVFQQQEIVDFLFPQPEGGPSFEIGGIELLWADWLAAILGSG